MQIAYVFSKFLEDNMILLLINFLGLSLIALIVWWFWLHKTPGVPANIQDIVVITVAKRMLQFRKNSAKVYSKKASGDKSKFG